jgi:hypothetical protein
MRIRNKILFTFNYAKNVGNHVMRRIFIPPDILSQPEDMDNPVMHHHRVSFREHGERRHLSETFPHIRQNRPQDTHSFSIFNPRLTKTESVREGLRDLPEVIIANQKMVSRPST